MTSKTSSSKEKSTPFNAERLESEVTHQFAFALGMISGYFAGKRSGIETEFEELPHGYSLAGGTLDTLAGMGYWNALKNGIYWSSSAIINHSNASCKNSSTEISRSARGNFFS